MDDQNKNLILATVLSFLVILVWYTVFAPPPADLTAPPPAAETTAAIGAAETAQTSATPSASAEALAAAPRVSVETPRLKGSISLLGGRIDDLLLSDYRVKLDPDSPAVRLLAPEAADPNAADKPYFALYGWAPGAGLDAAAVPGADTLWTLAKGDRLTPESPVELAWDNGKGLMFRRLIEVDKDFMFKITQSVENKGAAAVKLSSYGVIARRGLPKLEGFYIAHEGAIRMSDGQLEELDYDDFAGLDLPAPGGLPSREITVAQNGWIGFTDKYFMASLVPNPGQPFRSIVRFDASKESYEAWAIEPEVEVAPGASASVTAQLFAGAKKWEAIKAYQDAGIDRFVDSIDWGWFYFLTKPIFQPAALAEQHSSAIWAGRSSR